jgi:hypothetical protein
MFGAGGVGVGFDFFMIFFGDQVVGIDAILVVPRVACPRVYDASLLFLLAWRSLARATHSFA